MALHFRWHLINPAIPVMICLCHCPSQHKITSFHHGQDY